MKSIFKKFLNVSILLVVLIGIFALGYNTSAEFLDVNPIKAEASSSVSGIYDDRIEWRLEYDTGTLTVSGTGEMDFLFVPWDHVASNVKIVKIENGITSISSRAFEDCSYIESVSIPESVEKISGGAFFGFNNKRLACLKRIIVDENNAHYSNDEHGVLFNKDKTVLFLYPMGNKNSSYDIPSSVKFIDREAFSDCSDLSIIKLPEGLIKISERAFCNCTGLIGINIPESVEEIDDKAFYGCLNLQIINLGENVKKFGLEVFDGTSYYNNQQNWKDGVLYISCYLIEASENVPSSYCIKEGIKMIVPNAFYQNKTIENITIPDGVESIGSLAFYECTNLKSVSFGENCSIKTLSCGLFSGCENLSEVSIPESVEYMESQVFEMCDSIEYMYIPASVAQMEFLQFTGCISLKFIEVDKNNPNYSNDAHGVLYNKDKTILIAYPAGSELETYKVENNVEIIEQDAFWESQNLVEVVFDEKCKIKKIDHKTFYGTKSLKTITIPASVETIGIGAFDSCEKLETVYFEDESKLNEIGYYAFRFCSSLKLIDIPNQFDNVGWQTFKGCTSLERIVIPNAESIAYQAFYGCENLKSIVIPSGVLKIDDFAFNGCDKLTDVYYMGSPSEWQKMEISLPTEVIFSNAPLKNATIHYAKNDGDAEIATKMAVDNETGISLEYIKNFYDGNVELDINECTDNIAKELLNNSINDKQSLVYDIKMLVDGVEIQPNGKVKVKIPLPNGYDPDKTSVCHVDTALNRFENMNAEYIDGYLVFETNHFSYYAVVDETEIIVNIAIPTQTSISYGDSMILHVDASKIPMGGYVEWTASNDNFEIVEVSADGTTCKITPKKSGDTTFTATIYDAERNAIATDEQEMTSKAGFFDKIIAFFKKLFGLTKTYENVFKGIN